MLQQVFAEPDLVPRRPGELQPEGSLEDEDDAGAEAEVSDLLPLRHLLRHLLHLHLHLLPLLHLLLHLLHLQPRPRLLGAAGGTLQHMTIISIHDVPVKFSGDEYGIGI